MQTPICHIELAPENSARSITARIKLAGEEYQLWIRADQDSLSPNLEGFIAAALLPAMTAGGGAIRVEGEVSRQLIENFQRIQGDYHTWNPDFHPVWLEGAVPKDVTPLQGNNRRGIFFSGGVDSFYSFLAHRKEVTDLIFIHGSENLLHTIEYRQRLSAILQKTANHYGVNLIQVETNLRDLTDQFVPYGMWGWPIPLAMTGQVLYPAISEMRISVEYFPGVHISGSENLPLWNNPACQFTLSDKHVTRMDKVGYLAQDDFALQHLHVCHRTPETALNCGRCEKCIRTMLNLEVHGALERCPTFATDLTPRSIGFLNLRTDTKRIYMERNLDALEKKYGETPLTVAIRTALNPSTRMMKLFRLLYRIRKKLFGHRKF